MKESILGITLTAAPVVTTNVTNQPILKLHEKIHNVKNPYGCSCCDNKRNQSVHLKPHEKGTHKSELNIWECYSMQKTC